MRIAIDTTLNIEPNVMLASSIQLKNLLKSSWSALSKNDEDEEQHILSVEDKDHVRRNILECLIQSLPKPILRQLEECFILIASKDFPDAWPSFLNQIKEGLGIAKEEQYIYGLLHPFIKLFDILRYKERDHVKIVGPLISEIINKPLYELANKLTSVQNDVAANFLRIIARIYEKFIVLSVPMGLIAEEVFSAWMLVFQSAFNWPPIEEEMTPPKNMEEVKIRSKLPRMKMKTSISALFLSVFELTCSNNEKSARCHFIDFLQKNYVTPMLSLYLNLLQANIFFSPEFVTINLNFIRFSMFNQVTVEIIKPLLPQILNFVAFPLLLLKDDEVELWKTDQINFLHQEFSDPYLYNTPRTAAAFLIYSTLKCKYFDQGVEEERKNHPILNDFLAFLVQLTEESVNTNNLITFDAVLYIINVTKHIIKKYPEQLSKVKSLLATYALRGVSNSTGIIRMRCCQVLSTYAAINRNDEKLALQITEKLLDCIQDKNVSVQVFAAIAITRYAKAECVHNYLRPHAASLALFLTKLLSKAEFPELLSAIKELVQIFAGDVAQYGAELISQLTEAYGQMNLHTTEEDKKAYANFMFFDEEIGDGVCLSTITDVISILRHRQDILNNVEPIIVQLFTKTFTPQEIYMLENIVRLLESYTYYKDTISPNLWKLFPILIEATVGLPKDVERSKKIRNKGNWAYESTREITVIIQNYIIKSPDIVLAGNHLEEILYFIFRLIQIGNAANYNYDKHAAISIFISLLEGLTVIVL